MPLDWNTFITQDPWKYFNLPPEEEQRLRTLFTIKVGPNRITNVVDSILLDMSYDDPVGHPEKYVCGIGDEKQIAGAMLYIIGDFIAQYHKLGRRLKIRLLPPEIMSFFCYPHNQFQDLNLQSQYRTVKRLNKKYKRGLIIHGT